MTADADLHELESSTLNTLKRLLPEQPGLLLAVSGGLDSMALLEIAGRIRDRWHGPIGVAHLNHGLRGSNSDHDAQFVRNEAARRGFPVEIAELPVNLVAANSRGSLEESARQQRYKFLSEAAQRQELKAVVTAHQSSDQAETILHNLFRGTGLTGLRGMPEVRSLNAEVLLVRPLLAWSRDELQHYANVRSVVFVQDESNTDPRFTRNRIRNDVLPLLKASVNPQIEAAIHRLASQTSEVVECLDALSDKLLLDAILEATPELCRLQRTALASSPPALLRHMFVRLWVRLSWPRQQMTARHWQQLSDSVMSDSASFTLPGSIQFETRGSLLRLARRPGDAGAH